MRHRDACRYLPQYDKQKAMTSWDNTYIVTMGINKVRHTSFLVERAMGEIEIKMSDDARAEKLLSNVMSHVEYVRKR